MINMNPAEDIFYAGADDRDIVLFENQYPVPKGMSYNSYVIMDEQPAIMDTVDGDCAEQWLANVKAILGDRKPAYLVTAHMEPDHTGGIPLILKEYPEIRVAATAKALSMIPQFFPGVDISDRQIPVKEGDELSLGKHTLKFVTAPMVHWPEVMVTYDETSGVLFSADAFGKFGAIENEDGSWDDEARRYYCNICGKYGIPVTTLLKKASALDIKTIAPLHGPVLTGDLSHYLSLYTTWSSYSPEESGVVIAAASIHGNTLKAAQKLKEILESKGEKNVELLDLSTCDVALAVSEAFRYDRLVLAASSYDAGVFPPMETFIAHLKAKAFQNRRIGLLENGSWAPSAARTMKQQLEGLKNLDIIDPAVTIRSALKPEDDSALEALADALVKND